jgi:proline iminopeptidase
MPRFPATAGQALIVMVLGLGVGFVGGIALRSRLAMLVVPVASVLFFAVGRLATNVHGPTIDGIHLDTTYGIVAFGLGFVVPGVLGLLPMVAGASLGAALARRLSVTTLATRRPAAGAWLYARRGISTLTIVALVALSVGIAQPATTPAVRGTDGTPLPGSIASLDRVRPTRSCCT